MISKNTLVATHVRSEQFRRAQCGNSARWDLYGGGWVTGRPTVIEIKLWKWWEEALQKKGL